jgi:type II secretory pathway component PulL
MDTLRCVLGFPSLRPKPFCDVEMPPICSRLMAALSAAAVQAAMSGACVGQGVRVTWRERGRRWTTWREVFLCTLAFLSFIEENG